jgi:hypothetical protein
MRPVPDATITPIGSVNAMIASTRVLDSNMTVPASSRRLGVHSGPPVPFTRSEKCVFALVVGMFIAARLVHLGSFRLWFDEIFTLQVAERDWSNLLSYVKNYDVHPPLFYLLTRAWLMIGGRAFLWLGLFPAITAIATLVPIYLLCRELRLRPAEIIVSVAFMSLNGYLAGYAQEFRVYDFLMLLTVISLWAFVRFCNETERVGRTLIPLALVNVLVGYTHYYGWLVIGTEGLFLLFWNGRKATMFALCMVAAAVAYIPWAALVIQAAAARVAIGEPSIFPMPRPDLFSVLFFYAALQGVLDLPHSTLIGFALFGAPVAAWLLSIAFRRIESSSEKATMLWFALFSVLPVAVAFVACQALPTAIWGQRHLIVVAAPYYLFLATAIYRLRPAGLRRLALVALLGWTTVAGISAHLTPYKIIAWDVLVREIAERTPPGQPTVIYTVDEDGAFPMQFYLDRAGRHDITVAVVREDNARNRLLFGEGQRKPYWALSVPVLLIRNPKDLGDAVFWVCEDRTSAAHLGFPEKSLRQVFADAGYVTGPSISTPLVNRRWNMRTVGVFPVSGSPSIARR